MGVGHCATGYLCWCFHDVAGKKYEPEVYVPQPISTSPLPQASQGSPSKGKKDKGKGAPTPEPPQQVGGTYHSYSFYMAQDQICLPMIYKVLLHLSQGD